MPLQNRRWEEVITPSRVPADALDSELAFLEQEEAAATAVDGAWKLLVVDTDPQVHENVRQALADYRFDNGRVEILSAGSAGDARALLGEHADIAVVLLEAVLETDTAGLELIPYIRQELANPYTRVIVCTAHPDRVPEDKVVEAYDVNDYRTRAHFTADRLRTSLTMAVRTYASLLALATSRKELARVAVATAGLLDIRTPDRLFEKLLPRLISLLGIGADAMVCTQGDILPHSSKIWIRAGIGRFAHLHGVDLATLDEPKVVAALDRLGERSETVLEPDYCVLRLRAHGGILCLVYAEGRHSCSSHEWQLLDLFRNKASIAFENTLLLEEVSGSQKAAVLALASLAEFKDNAAPGHLQRTGRLVGEMARELRRQGHFSDDLDDDLVEKLGLASILHDVGMISISDETLNIPGELVEEDREQIHRHTDIGHRILTDASQPLRGRSLMSIAAEIALSHHERYDGTGYRRGLAGNAIPIGARITAVADVFDALVTERPYRRAWPLEEAVSWIQEQAGKGFDPLVVEAFVTVIRRIQEQEPEWLPVADSRVAGFGGVVGKNFRRLFRRLSVPQP